jgi:hypothetical protein
VEVAAGGSDASVIVVCRSCSWRIVVLTDRLAGSGVAVAAFGSVMSIASFETSGGERKAPTSLAASCCVGGLAQQGAERGCLLRTE